MDWFTRLLDTSDFPPRWQCGNWTAPLGWTHILSDLAIFGAFLAISLSLAYFVARGRRVPFLLVFWCFVVFIFSCGCTHLIDAIIFSEPIYRVSAGVKVVTSLASWATVVALVSVIPRALRLPGVIAANERMATEITERERAQAELERVRERLEARSSELSMHRHRVGNAMEAAAVLACQWVVESGEMIWEIGGAGWIRALGLRVANGDITSWKQVLADEEFARFVAACQEAIRSRTEVDFETSVLTPSGRDCRFRIGARIDMQVNGEPRTATGMARLILSLGDESRQ